MQYIDVKEWERFAKWIGLVVFFLAAPAGTLYVASAIIVILATDGDAEVKRFLADRPLILICFYSGTIGSILSYVYGRVHEGARTSSSIVRKISILLLGGIMGTAVFFVVRSGWIIQLLYPNLTKEPLEKMQLNYYSLVVLSVLCGLLGPTIIAKIRDKTARPGGE